MGSIMCLGVSVSNSVMLVTFIDEHWKKGDSSRDAAVKGAERATAADSDDRLRDDGGHGADGAGARTREPDAGPLGRAVIGGLVMSTFATLLVVPSIFALVIGRKMAESASIYPDDPESPITTRMRTRMKARPSTARSRARQTRTAIKTT